MNGIESRLPYGDMNSENDKTAQYAATVLNFAAWICI